MVLTRACFFSDEIFNSNIMSNRDRIPAVSMTEQRRPENAQNRSQGGFRQPMHFVGSQQRQPLQQAGRGIEQKVIKKEDIPRLNSTPKEVKQVGVECVSPYDEEEWVNIGKEKKRDEATRCAIRASTKAAVPSGLIFKNGWKQYQRHKCHCQKHLGFCSHARVGEFSPQHKSVRGGQG